ncbi:NADAR family protein [Bacillus vallismortis]|uniref:NADAR family protein n=1 Tax=Bacillus vallismortis TaxID=72361 RepID=UPI003DB2162D
MNIKYVHKIYKRNEVVTFRKTKEEYGGLSNMAGGFNFELEGVRILSSEALYQAMRYPDYPEYQKAIITQKSPMTAKMISKKYKQYTRDDWVNVRLMIMRWCIRVKLINNWNEFGLLLLKTGDKPIVEESHKDDFWGAKPSDLNLLVGTNALGRLLMELRTELPKYIGKHELSPPKIPNFKLLGKEVSNIKFENKVMPKELITRDNFENLSFFD